MYVLKGLAAGWSEAFEYLRSASFVHHVQLVTVKVPVNVLQGLPQICLPVVTRPTD